MRLQYMTCSPDYNFQLPGDSNGALAGAYGIRDLVALDLASVAAGSTLMVAYSA